MQKRRKGALRSRQERIANEILMYFRSQRKLQGEVYLSDSIDGDGDGNSLSLLDTISVDDNMLEELDAKDACAKVRRCVAQCLDEREAMVITLRYGLNAKPPLTQREIAARCGISRSYVSQRRYCKRSPESLVGQDFRALRVTGGSFAVIVSDENFRKISGYSSN